MVEIFLVNLIVCCLCDLKIYFYTFSIFFLSSETYYISLIQSYVCLLVLMLTCCLLSDP